MTDALAESFAYHRSGGALIQDVTADGPAARAGVKPGDIITSVAGDSVRNRRCAPRCQLVILVRSADEATQDAPSAPGDDETSA